MHASFPQLIDEEGRNEDDFKSLDLKREDIEISTGDALGQGSSGLVRLGTVRIQRPLTSRSADNRSIQAQSTCIQCAVKTLKEGSSFEDEIRFICECKLLGALRHPCIIRLVGICSEVTPMLMMMEYASLGSLKDYLKKNKPSEIPSTARNNSDSDIPLNASTLTLFSSQVCSAMVFLEKHRIVHRDLAARNVLVLEANRVKLSDFGLSRLLSNTDCKTCTLTYDCMHAH
jgi:serine/threonine protein kinase